jgi:hypothetical protein
MTAKHRRLPTTHRGRRALAGVAAAGLLTVGVAGAPAYAAKNGGGKPTGGSGGTGSSLSLSTPLVYDANGDGKPNWGDTVTFDVSTSATQAPYVDLTCVQGGTQVYSATGGWSPNYPWPWSKNMNLTSDLWTSGAASCHARLYMITRKGTSTLATLDFAVGA